MTKANLANLKSALENFDDDTGRYPTTAEGLGALTVAPAGLPKWNGPYIQSVPTDGWGLAIGYTCAGAVIELRSAGPDGVDGTADDISMK